MRETVERTARAALMTIMNDPRVPDDLRRRATDALIGYQDYEDAVDATGSEVA